MNTVVKFVLQFGNKNVLVKFNAEEKAPEHKIGLNGRAFLSVAFANVLGETMNVLNPSFKVKEPGMYLHQSFEEVRESLGNDNLGYVLSSNLEKLVEEGTVKYRNEIVPDEIFRLHYDGCMKIYASMVTVKEYTEDESDYVRHNRHAYALVKNLEILRKAEAKGVNIRLFYTEAETPRFELLKMQWDLFMAEKYEELAETIATGIEKAKVYQTMKYFERSSVKAVEAGKPFVVQLDAELKGVDNTVKAGDLIGKTIQFKGARLLPTKYPVTADNLGTIMAAAKARGLKVVVVEEEVGEVMPLVIKSKAPRRSGKKAAA